jgi:SAM-dependent methyltransferase
VREKSRIMSSEMREGVYHIDYHQGRQTKRALKYRLYRRSQEVLRAIGTYAERPVRVILDVGTADGAMLDALQSALKAPLCVGLDLSLELLRVNENPNLDLIQGNALYLPFARAVFDVVVATAVIEHLSQPRRFVMGCRWLLRQGGLMVITTPDPFFERIATAIGHLPEEGHNQTFNLRQLRQLFLDGGFQVLEAQKFMMSPVGFPLEIAFERAVKALGLSALLLNQIVVVQKIGNEPLML